MRDYCELNHAFRALSSRYYRPRSLLSLKDGNLFYLTDRIMVLLQRIIDQFRHLYQGSFARSATGTFGLKVSLIALSFITSILLARTLDVTGYGLYSYIMAWVMLLQIPAGLGLQTILARELAAYRGKSEWGLMQGILQWSNIFVLAVSVIVSVIAVICVWVFQGQEMLQTNIAFGLAFLSLPLMTLTGLRMGAMRGLDKVVEGQLPEGLVQPLLFIAMLLFIVFLGSDSLTWVIGVRVIAMAFAFCLGAFLLYRNIPLAVKTSTPTYEVKRWLSGIPPFMLITVTHAINNRTDAIMLGAIAGTDAVAIYTVAHRGSQLVNFALVAINMSLGPRIVRLYQRGDMEELQRIITKSNRALFVVSLAISLVLVVFGRYFLLLFGSDFTRGSLPLIILVIGQLINAFCGSSGVLLSMTGNERDSATGIGLSAILNIFLNASLIPRFQAEGAAVATTASLVFWNIFLLIRVRQRLGIAPTALGRFGN